MTKKNPFSKSVPIDKAHAMYQATFKDLGVVTVVVLKTYKKPDNCKADPNSTWFTAAKSDATFGSWEYGDQYADDIMNKFQMIGCTPEWKEAYHADY